MKDAQAQWESGRRDLAAQHPGLPALAGDVAGRVRAALESAIADGGTFAFVDHACATLAVAGDSLALRFVIEGLLRKQKASIERFRRDGLQPDDVCSDVEARLFDPEKPALAQYSGRGSLEGWLRVILTRAALDARRRSHPARDGGSSDDLPHLRAPIDDPELEAIRKRSGEEFRLAFYDAIAGLPDEQRAALRMHLFEELTLDETARALGVHRATVARWLAAAREQLFAATRRLLAERLSLGLAECESLSRFVLSGVDLSLARVLRE